MEEPAKDESLKKRHFARLHERIQSKFDEMQRKLEKSKSVDSLSSLKEDYVYKHRYASNTEINQIDDTTNHIHLEKHNVKHSVIVEEIRNNTATLQYVNIKTRNMSESEITPQIKENDGDANNFFEDDISRMSLESLNEVARESDEYQTPTPPPPISISIRNKIGSRFSAIKDKSRQSRKESNTTRTKNEKKTSRDKVEKYILSNTTKQDVVKIFRKTKLATVTVALIEASGLDANTAEDVSKMHMLFCRFRLGSEKYKSKVIKSHKSEVKWQELFNFNLYEDNVMEISLWDKDVCVGRSHIDLSEIEKERTHKMRIKLEREVGNTQIFILLTISGVPLVSLDEFQEMQSRLAILRNKSPGHIFRDDSTDVGFLSVIVHGARGLAGTECHCVVELDNERLQTQTESKTNDPYWMKILTFEVKDITSILNITVHDEKRSEDIGCLLIPLLRIENGRKRWYALKDPSLRERARGANPRILLEMNVIWKLVKASVRVVTPKEIIYLVPKQKLDRHTFSRNLSRAKVVFNWIMSAFGVVKTCFEWESRRMNIIALSIWLLFCWVFKVWMLPLLLLIPFIWYRPPKYFLLRWKDYLIKGTPLPEENKKEKEDKLSLRDRINSLTEMVQSVQNFIGEFASLGESIKNLFNFSVPFLSFLAIFFILVITFVMFTIPTKYIFMIWGLHKFTRKILRPNRVPNNEILDLLSRVPNDEVLFNCEEIPLEEVPEEDVIKE